MANVLKYDNTFARLLPVTERLLVSGGLVLHSCVKRVTLHGSRGLFGGYRPDSDIDLAFHVDDKDLANRPDFGQLLRQVLLTTLDNWKGKVELDLAAVFDKSGCGLTCFDRTIWDSDACPSNGMGCLGLYKIQKGFDGFVSGPAVQVQLMYPMLTIWRCC